MSGYSDRGAGAGGHDEGYSNREDVTGPEGVVIKDNLVVDENNPNIVRAIPPSEAVARDETAGVTATSQTDARGTYPDVIEGSDSERTGTSWGVPPHEDVPTVNTPRGAAREGTGEDDASPNRNTGGVKRDDLADVGSWSTIPEDTDSAGSPTSSS
jgi:hypothetical protein